MGRWWFIKVYWTPSAFLCAHLISSSLAKIMTTLAFGFSLSLRITLSNSPGFGSRGIFTDWEMHKPPKMRTKRNICKLTCEFVWNSGTVLIRQTSADSLTNYGLRAASSLFVLLIRPAQDWCRKTGYTLGMLPIHHRSTFNNQTTIQSI